MCGFLGFVGGYHSGFDQRWNAAKKLQFHRGPDDQKEISFNRSGKSFFLGFQRLKILDLTSRGNQPMVSSDKKNIILFNGEIYNFIEIKNELKSNGIDFQSNSDTEVLFKALRLWGVKKACQKFNGMWAFIYINLISNKIYLSRDRFGKKPLYYFINNDGLYFSSEAKSLLTMIGKKFKLDYQVIGEFILQGNTNSSNKYFLKNIVQSPPNKIIKFEITENIKELESVSYWTFPKENNVIINTDSFRDIFFNSVNLRLRSDVPVGVLLSGGLDSSSIAVASAMQSKKNITLFSAIGSDNDEEPYIDEMSRFLNLEVNKINLSLEDYNVFELLENLIWINDQPLPSLSNISHYLLTKKASDLGLKVLLTGQGADELLCGYRKYFMLYVLYLFKNGKISKASKLLFDFYKNRTFLNQFNLLEAKPYINLMSGFGNSRSVGSIFQNYNKLELGLNDKNIFHRQLKDIKSLSIPQLLHTEDRMSMASSTEMRVPFLDYRLVELILPLSIDQKLNKGWSKYIFRQAMKPYLPESIVWRRDKQGFGNMQGELLKKDLKKIILNDYLSSNSLIYEKKIFNKKRLIKSFQAYSKQAKNKGLVSYREAFAPISLEIWLRKFESFIA